MSVSRHTPQGGDAKTVIRRKETKEQTAKAKEKNKGQRL